VPEEIRVLEKSYVVTEQLAIHFMGPEVPPVLSTPALLMWLELTARENAGPLLGPGEDTLGVSVALKHLAATPVGMGVRVVSRLVEVEGRVYTFELEAFDAFDKIAEATHQRASVLVAKFGSRIEAKREKAKSSEPR
jgi:fluoroacetyl-CoA thioesterase